MSRPHTVGTKPMGELGRIMLMLLGAVIFAVDMKSFIQAGELLPGGFNSLALLLQRVGERFWGVHIPFSVLVFPMHLVPISIAFRYIGKHFTLYSVIFTVCSGLLTDLLPDMPITNDLLLIVVFGGIINGCATGMCLIGRASSGGTDFIAIALSERLKVDAWNYIMLANAIILAVSGALFGWDKTLYSIIFQYATTLVVKMFDTSFKRTTLFIVTQKDAAGAVCHQIQETHHSATLFHGVGLYDGQERTMIYTVVEEHQVRSLIRHIHAAAPGSFINALKTDQIDGNFYRRPRD